MNTRVLPSDLRRFYSSDRERWGLQPHTASLTTEMEAIATDLRQVPRDQLRLMKPRRQLARAFDEFHIDDASFLEEAEGRSCCAQCMQSRKYFCYSCYLPLQRFQDRVPSVKLPFRVDIVKHAREVAGKSTAVHAPILAPEHVQLYTYPHMPDYAAAGEKVVLVSPGPGAIQLEDLATKPAAPSPGPGSCAPFDRAVLIDCTWNQVKKILHDPRVAGLQRVELRQHETLFWRYQTGKPHTYLATIEALYYLVLDVHRMMSHGASTPRTLVKGVSNAPERHTSPQDLQLRTPDAMQDQHSSTVVSSDVSDGELQHCPSPLTYDSNRGTESGEPPSQSSAPADCALAQNRLGAAQQEACGGANSSNTVEEERRRTTTSSKEMAAVEPQERNRPLQASSRGFNQDQLFIDDCCHQYDNLLFYFKFMFEKIHKLYGAENLRAYK